MITNKTDDDNWNLCIRQSPDILIISMVAIMAVVYVFTSAINIIFWRLAITILIVLYQTEFANVDFICDDFCDIERCGHIGITALFVRAGLFTTRHPLCYGRVQLVSRFAHAHSDPF